MNKNLPAYPLPLTSQYDGRLQNSEDYDTSSVGLTKLEAFTMAAMQGLLSNAHCYWNNQNGLPYYSGESISDIALKQAIATLEALEKVK